MNKQLLLWGSIVLVCIVVLIIGNIAASEHDKNLQLGLYVGVNVVFGLVLLCSIFAWYKCRSKTTGGSNTGPGSTSSSFGSSLLTD